jgi:hypothetical protein
MSQSNAKLSFRQRLIAAVQSDERIVGLLQGGCDTSFIPHFASSNAATSGMRAFRFTWQS